MDPHDSTFSLRQPTSLLNVPKFSYYYQPATETAENLVLMKLIDQEYTKHPFYGTRRIEAWLQREGYKVNRKRIQRLMRLAGICPKRNLSKAANKSRIYPYLLRGVEIARSNYVWSGDIIYVALKGGFVYLTSIIDWYSRYILSWRLQTVWIATFAWRHWKRLLRRVNQKFSTRTKESSTRVESVQDIWKSKGWKSV